MRTQLRTIDASRVIGVNMNRNTKDGHRLRAIRLFADTISSFRIGRPTGRHLPNNHNHNRKGDEGSYLLHVVDATHPPSRRIGLVATKHHLSMLWKTHSIDSDIRVHTNSHARANGSVQDHLQAHP